MKNQKHTLKVEVQSACLSTCLLNFTGALPYNKGHETCDDHEQLPRMNDLLVNVIHAVRDQTAEYLGSTVHEEPLLELANDDSLLGIANY